jgi:formylmethanofuran dehydrogenase subunit E
MDMKRILQAMDGITTKPVAGVSDMCNFLSIIKKNDVEILNEGSPHKVALPVQMAMQHYQPAQTTEKKVTNTLGKYFHVVEQELEEQKTSKRQLINQYASVIAKRVLVKEGQVIDFPKKHEFHDKLTHCTKCGGQLQNGKDDTGERVKVCVPCLRIYHNRTEESSNGGVVPGHRAQFTGGVGAPGLQSNDSGEGNLTLGVAEAKRMSAQVKLSRAWDREHAKSVASKDRADKAKAEFEKDWKEKQEKSSIKETNAAIRKLKRL